MAHGFAPRAAEAAITNHPLISRWPALRELQTRVGLAPAQAKKSRFENADWNVRAYPTLGPSGHVHCSIMACVSLLRVIAPFRACRVRGRLSPISGPAGRPSPQGEYAARSHAT